MSQVVVLTWEATTQVLVYVPVDGGNGGEARPVRVSGDWATDIAAVCAASSLPSVGELVVDGDEVLLDLSGPPVTLCSPRWRKPVVRLLRRDGGQLVREMPPEALGLGDVDLAAQVENIGSFLLFDEADKDGVIGCWDCAGGLSGWLERLQARRAAKAAARGARERAAAADLRFINPYTFVPFPAAIVRERPAGHDALGPGRMSGVLEVSFEFTSPMQAPEGAISGQRLRLPGASVKGALRSLHETLAGGCLRVLDEDYVPSYRDAAAVPHSEWTLAVAETVTRDGQPLTVRLCDPVVWVGAAQLRAAWGSRLSSGNRVTFDPPREMTGLERYELPADATVERGGDWVVLLTDAGARRPETRLKKPGAYFAACGRVGDDTAVRSVDETAWRAFRRAVAGAREAAQQRAAQRAGESSAQWVPVKFRGEEIGRRKAATGRFDVGDVLWARRRPGGAEVDGLRLAAIWRHAGTGPLGTRVPDALHPCPPSTSSPGSAGADDELLLCPSCRLFGAADARTPDAGSGARQRAYAGHVRFGDAVSDGPVELTLFQRAPLGAPRPGAGQFYLRYSSTAPATSENAAPTREWGAAPDGATARLVRGRKYYWHADPTRQPVPRHVARSHQINPRMLMERQLAPAGTVLRAVLTFDNLSDAEVGGLLATLQPDLVLPAEEPDSRPLRLRLGGGKPLGLGSCRAIISNVRVWSARSRYGGVEPITATPEHYRAEFSRTVPAPVTATWPALTAVLREQTVDAARVWYPPGAYWSDQRTDAKLFDEPFGFFVGTSGMYLAKEKARPLLPLPEPTDPDQSLPIIRKQDLGKGAEGRG